MVSQVDPRDTHAAKRHLKRAAHRLLRRQGKALLEEAPTKIRQVLRGWWY